jgi:6-phosphogluconolactonase
MERTVIIGTYTQHLGHVDGHADGILSAVFDGTRVRDVEVVADVTNPSWVAVAAGGRRVYAVSETDPDGGVAAFGRDADGAFRPLGTASSGGAEPANLVVHPTGRFLATGTYGGGSVSVFALDDEGALGERTAFVQHEGHGPDPDRQASPHVHQLTFDPVTGDLVVVDLGLGEVRWYAMDEGGRLTLRPDATVVTGASGPRHLAYHRDDRHAFLVNELDSTLDVLRRDGDRFVRVQAVSTRPAGALGANKPAAVRISEDGETVLVSNRGDNTVALFAFDPSGESSPGSSSGPSYVRLVGTVSAHGREPRDMVVVPGGHRVLVANQNSDDVTVFAFDQKSRELEFLGSSPVPTPVCLAVI